MDSEPIVSGTEASSMMHYFAELQTVAYKAGLIMGVSIGVALGLMTGIIAGAIFYKVLHRHMGGHVLTKAK